jgi:hypothetical protein
MIARLLASAAAAVIFTGISTVSFAQNSSPSSPMPGQSTQQMGAGDQSAQPMGQSAPKRKSAKSSSGMKNSSSTTNKQMAQGHKLDNIADKLNACATRPTSERQSCIDQATHM